MQLLHSIDDSIFSSIFNGVQELIFYELVISKLSTSSAFLFLNLNEFYKLLIINYAMNEMLCEEDNLLISDYNVRFVYGWILGSINI